MEQINPRENKNSLKKKPTNKQKVADTNAPMGQQNRKKERKKERKKLEIKTTSSKVFAIARRRFSRYYC